MRDNPVFTEDEIKQEFIRKYYENEESLEDASKEDIEKYKEYVEEGLNKDWPIALYAKGYGCYGGDRAFECDWNVARDCFLKLIEIQGDKDAFVYNSLGYIYYYGRCNDGEPEYDKAFKYFSVGAANGVFESTYKCADMFIGGKGVPKSEKAGVNLIMNIYNENKDNFSNEAEGCKFADVALRVGGLFERGCGVEQDFETAYFHYYEAKYAIERRMEEDDFYGDKSVHKNICEALERVKEKLPESYFMDSISLPDPALIGILLSESVGLDIELKKEGEEYYLVAKRYATEEMTRNVLFNIPRIDFCALINELQVKVVGLENIEDFALPKQAFIDTIIKGNDDRTWLFCHRDVPMLKIVCDEYILEKDN